MIEKARSFREKLNHVEQEVVFDSIAVFSTKIAEEFKLDFPEYDISVYENSPLWQMLIGSSVPSGYVDETPTDVQEWLEIKITDFLNSIKI